MFPKILLTLSLLLLSSTMIRCGMNVYEPLDTKDPMEAAAVALEEQKPKKAIKILESALRKDPDNPDYLSLLASAKAQYAGVDTIDLALRLISDNEADGEKNEIEQLFGLMPEANSKNIELLDEAIAIMNRIPEEEQTAGDRFKLSMFFTSLMTLRTKILDRDGDGELSLDELELLDDELALKILLDLDAAEESFGGSAGDQSTADSGAADKIADIRRKIHEEEGESDAERLRNFLSK